ncbi:MAG: SURF1 family cytochrome oxidase biogenesis protein, partial [Microbacteriaceae bacterium]
AAEERRALWALARTPRWIGALLAALAVACVFGALGQWQISRALASVHVEQRATETAVPLDSVATPQQAVTTAADGQMVTVTARDVGDYVLLDGRLNGGETGYWVMAHYVTDDGASLAVALGWSADRAAAEAVVAAGPGERASAVALTGRYLVSESPTGDDVGEQLGSAASVEALVNLWSAPQTPVYDGYLVAATALAPGLTTIDSPAPTEQVRLNWLNVFYALEWLVFAVLAFYMWYRLLKDARERELEELEDAADVG